MSAPAARIRLGTQVLPDRQAVTQLAPLFLVAFGLRLLFAFGPGRVPVIWDAAAYWGEAERIRGSLCASLHFCHAAAHQRAGVGDTADIVLFSKSGLLPLLQGAAMTVLPNSPATAQVLFALLDAGVCVMVAAVLLRLGAPRWIALLAGLIQAFYVPGIVGSAAFLQQPLIRFGLVAWVLAEAYAFTSSPQRQQRWVALAAAALVVVAFASQSTRPLLWLLPAAAVVLASLMPGGRVVAVAHLRIWAGIAGVLVAGAAVIALLPSGHSFLEALTNLGLGLSTSGTAAGQVTVLGFSHFWPSDAWTFFKGANSTESLLSDFGRAPVEFAKLSGVQHVSQLAVSGFPVLPGLRAT